MRRLFLVALGLGVSTSAHALGVGTTYSLGSGLPWDLGPFLDVGAIGTSGGFLPSLDLHPGNVTVQIHALETLQVLANEELFLGANCFFGVVEQPNTGAALGVVEPGFGVDLWADPFVLIPTFETRIGVKVPGSMSWGVYAVPALGVAISDNDTDIVIAGGLQFSAWFGS